MEVLVGSRFGIGTAGSYVRDRSGVVAQDKALSAALFLKEESSRIGVRSAREEFTESSSSIGESSDNEEVDDAVSSHGGEWLGSFASSLEDSLPIKRGLSNHYMGKSKSFGNLMEARDLEKLESPLNKRRRLVIANKLRIRSSLSSRINPNSMPLLTLQESDEEIHNDHDNDDDDDDDDDSDDDDDQTSKLQEKRMKMTSNSCFCLSSLQHDDDR